MKIGLPSSIAFHAIVLAWGLLTLSAPKAFNTGDVEALPIDVVPFDSMSSMKVGEKQAPANNKPAPKPSQKPPVENAKNKGDNTVDLKPTPQSKPDPKPVEAAEQPKASPQPVTKPSPTPEPTPAKKAEPVPAPEIAATAKPKQDVKPDPVAETIAAESPNAETVKLPENVPSPEARPQPPKAQTARTPDRKETQKPPAQPSTQAAAKDDKALTDQIAALLNHEKPSGGGAKHSSEQTASLGGDRDSGGEKLSQSEMDALRAQIQRCWNPPVGVSDATDLKISIKMKLDPSGAVEADPQVIAGGGDGMLGRIAAESAKRAVLRCAPYKLPADKYQAWADVIVNFDPSQMF